jgi:hypothetical protein
MPPFSWMDSLPSRRLMHTETSGKCESSVPGDDVEALGERLWAWLREHYPERPRLALVKPASAPVGTVSYRGRQIDPRLLSDPRSPLAKARYHDRLVKAAALRSGVLRFRDD